MNEDERLAICHDIAARMYAAGMGDCYNAIERLTRPAIDRARIAALMILPEPTPYERGVLDRYQDKKSRHRRHGR